MCYSANLTRNKERSMAAAHGERAHCSSSHGVTPAFKACRLGPRVVLTLRCPLGCRRYVRSVCCTSGLRRIKSCLIFGPRMALEFIARLLLSTLAVLRIDKEISCARLLRGYLALQARRRSHGLILADPTVPLVIITGRVIVRNALPPQRRVIERES